MRRRPRNRPIERNTETAREREAVSIVMALGQRNERARQQNRVGRRTPARDRRDDVSADRGITRRAAEKSPIQELRQHAWRGPEPRRPTREQRPTTIAVPQS